MSKVTNLILFRAIFCCYVVSSLSLSLVVFGQTGTTLPQNWYCDERLNLNLKAGTVTEIIPLKESNKVLPRKFTQNNKKYEIVNLVKFKINDLFTGAETEEFAQFYNVKSRNLPAMNVEIGQKYVFAATSLQLQSGNKVEFVRPDDFIKSYPEATADIEFLRSTKDQNINQAILRTDFLDVPPVSSADIKTVLLVSPFHSKNSQEFKINNTVYVLTVIDESGRPVEARAFCAKNETVAKASEQAAMLSRFASILKEDKPLMAKGIIKYRFEEVIH